MRIGRHVRAAQASLENDQVTLINVLIAIE